MPGEKAAIDNVFLYAYVDSFQAKLDAIQDEFSSCINILEDNQHAFSYQLKHRLVRSKKDLFDHIDANKKALKVFAFSGHADNLGIQIGDRTLFYKGLGEELAKCENLRLVFLNACATAPIFQYLFPPNSKIRLAILTKYEVADNICAHVAEIFYRRFMSDKVSFREVWNDIVTVGKTFLRDLKTIDQVKETRRGAWLKERETDTGNYWIYKHHSEIEEEKLLGMNFHDLLHFEEEDEDYFTRSKQPDKPRVLFIGNQPEIFDHLRDLYQSDETFLYSVFDKFNNLRSDFLIRQGILHADILLLLKYPKLPEKIISLLRMEMTGPKQVKTKKASPEKRVLLIHDMTDRPLNTFLGSLRWSFNEVKERRIREEEMSTLKTEVENLILDAIKDHRKQRAINKQEAENKLQGIDLKKLIQAFGDFFRTESKVFNLLTVDGTPDCGHEILVKRLAIRAQVIPEDSNCRDLTVKFGVRTEQNVVKSLWLAIKENVLGVTDEAGIDQNEIAEQLMKKLEEEHQMLMITHFFSQNISDRENFLPGQRLAGLRQFWNSITSLNTLRNSKHKFFLLIVNTNFPDQKLAEVNLSAATDCLCASCHLGYSEGVSKGEFDELVNDTLPSNFYVPPRVKLHAYEELRKEFVADFNGLEHLIPGVPLTLVEAKLRNELNILE